MMRNLNKSMTSLAMASLMLLMPLSSAYALDPVADRQALADLGPGERSGLLQLAGVAAGLLDEIRAGYQQQVGPAGSTPDAAELFAGPYELFVTETGRGNEVNQTSGMVLASLGLMALIVYRRRAIA